MLFFDNTIFKIHFRYELSFLLIPLGVILYLFVPYLKPALLYHLVCIGLVGTLDGYYKIGTINGYGFSVISIIIHLLLLTVLCEYKKYGKINRLSIFLLFFANFVIYYLPYWPYKLCRETTAVLYNSIYICLVCIRLLFFYIYIFI